VLFFQTIKTKTKLINKLRMKKNNNNHKNGLFTLFQIMSAIRGATRLRRGGKSRKGRKNKGAGLSQDDIEYLTKNTKYDETEIKEWYKGFKVCFVLVLLLLFFYFCSCYSCCFALENKGAGLSQYYKVCIVVVVVVF
jgi:hypothetical protein